MSPRSIASFALLVFIVGVFLYLWLTLPCENLMWLPVGDLPGRCLR